MKFFRSIRSLLASCGITVCVIALTITFVCFVSVLGIAFLSIVLAGISGLGLGLSVLLIGMPFEKIVTIGINAIKKHKDSL